MPWGPSLPLYAFKVEGGQWEISKNATHCRTGVGRDRRETAVREKKERGIESSRTQQKPRKSYLFTGLFLTPFQHPHSSQPYSYFIKSTLKNTETHSFWHPVVIFYTSAPPFHWLSEYRGSSLSQSPWPPVGQSWFLLSPHLKEKICLTRFCPWWAIQKISKTFVLKTI